MRIHERAAGEKSKTNPAVPLMSKHEYEKKKKTETINLKSYGNEESPAAQNIAPSDEMLKRRFESPIPSSPRGGLQEQVAC